MKRQLTALAVLTLLTATTPLLADDPIPRDTDERAARHERKSVIDDVIRMSQANVDEDAILKFVRESHDLYVVDADVIIALTDAKVSKAVLEAVMDEAYDRGDRNPRDTGKRRTTRTVYVRSYPYSYNPWYSPYAYDPYFFNPVGFGFGFGYGGYRGGYNGPHGGGGHHGGGHHGRH